MQAFRQIAPDRWQLREGGGCIAIFGLPFLGAGILPTLMGLRIVPMENASNTVKWAWSLTAAIGLVFVAVGGWLVSGRTSHCAVVTRRTANRANEQPPSLASRAPARGCFD